MLIAVLVALITLVVVGALVAGFFIWRMRRSGNVARMRGGRDKVRSVSKFEMRLTVNSAVEP